MSESGSQSQQVADRDRFVCILNPEWQASRPETYYRDAIYGSFKRDGICGLRQEICRFIQMKFEDTGIFAEFVNCVSHLEDDLFKDGVSNLAVRPQKFDEFVDHDPCFATYRNVRECRKVLHKMFRLRQTDKRTWHIELSKMEKRWL